MVDPTSELGEDITEEDAPGCEACQQPIVNEPDHRVVTWITEGEVQTAHFCDDACRQDWSQ